MVNAEQIEPDLNNSIPDNDAGSAHCKGCKRQRPIDLFTNVETGRIYRRCCDYRFRKNARRNPGTVAAQQIIQPNDTSNGKIKL